MKASQAPSNTADKPAQTTAGTVNLQEALIAAHGETVTHRGNRYKLECRVINERFFCDAQNLTPKTEEEAKFCFTDLWRSESESSEALMIKFARKGGYITHAEDAAQRRQAGEQTEDDDEIYGSHEEDAREERRQMGAI